MHKDLRKLLDQYPGATARKTGGNHWRIALPNGGIVIASNTPSDRRALSEIRSDLRRAARRNGQNDSFHSDTLKTSIEGNQRLTSACRS